MHTNLLWQVPIVLYAGAGFILLMVGLIETFEQPQPSEDVGFWRCLGSICFAFFCGPGFILYLILAEIVKGIYGNIRRVSKKKI